MEYARATWTSFPRSRVKDWAEGVAFQGMSMADQVAGHSAKLRFISHEFKDDRTVGILRVLIVLRLILYFV